MTRAIILTLSCILLVAAVHAQPACVLQGRPVLNACSDVISHLQTEYILGSDEPMTPEMAESLRASEPEGVPSEECCNVVETFNGSGCACDTSLPNALAGIGLSISQTGLLSAFQYTAESCGQTPPTC